ncbi:MAG: GNAT family N-acetyltransferase [Terriglobia bacterium]
MKGFPRIHTTRLVLCPVSVDDLGALHHLWTNPDVRKYLWDDTVISEQRAASEIEKSIASFETCGFGLWSIFLQEQETLFGFCGLRYFGDPNPPEVELLCGLEPTHWAQGYATEAALAVLRYGFEEIHLAGIMAGADKANEASFRLMKRIGMTFGKRVHLHGREAVYYGVSPEAFHPASWFYRVQHA